MFEYQSKNTAVLIQKNILLSPFTTIKLGGPAAYFTEVKNKEELLEALKFAKSKKLKIHILGGGSNTVFQDKKLNKLVIKISLSSVSFSANGKNVFAKSAAGVNWDNFVKLCVRKNYQGLEALSGIPGTVGAAPIQNIGAYDAEVSQTIFQVKTLNLKTLREKTFTNHECRFAYRDSRFKNKDRNKYVVIEVIFRLKSAGRPKVKYPELKNLAGPNPTLKKIRESVLKLRRRKSMLINPRDPNSRSCGSFFLNPIISKTQFHSLQKSYPLIPAFPFRNKIKISAGWLIENSGFQKGYRENGVGLSEKHALALININGSAKNLLALAHKIQKSVRQKFQITLHPEPVVI